MEYQSRAIDTNQTGVHEQLEKVVRKHLAHPFRRPLAAHSEAIFADVDARVRQWKGPLVLDSCCGVGESTLALAQRHPDALVIGVDKSASRLARNHAYGDVSERCLLVRADLNDFWRQAADAGWKPDFHYILYPNPWPKSKHLQRRWHGGPLFPTIVSLGGELEVRSNWALYIEEFNTALTLAEQPSEVEQLPPDITPVTPFERKYQATGQSLWRLRCKLC